MTVVIGNFYPFQIHTIAQHNIPNLCSNIGNPYSSMGPDEISERSEEDDDDETFIEEVDFRYIVSYNSETIKGENITLGCSRMLFFLLGATDFGSYRLL